MASVNKVILVGNLGQDPDLKQTKGGNPVCNLSVATNEAWTDKDGNKQERTEWHRVTVWGNQAEACDKYLQKGRQVYIEGRIQTRKWEDRDGNERYTTEIVASQIVFLSAGEGGRNRSLANGYKEDHPGEAGKDEDDIPF